MDNKTALEMLEQVARNSVAIDSLFEVLGDLVRVEDRKLYTPMFKELLSSNFELQSQIGGLYPELNPMFLGRENFSHLCKKYEDPNNPIPLPIKEDIEKSKKLWEKIQRMTKR